MHFRTFDFRHAESVLNGNYKLKKEIECILSGLSLERPGPFLKGDPGDPHRYIQRAFSRKRWATEVPVRLCATGGQRFDAFKDRVAIEIELSSRERLYRDYWRFLMAELEGRLDVGIIIVMDEAARRMYSGGLRNGAPHLEDVIADLNALRTAITVPIWAIALTEPS